MNSLKPFLPDADSGASTVAKPPARRARPWKVIAQEVSAEQDSAKLAKLVSQLGGTNESSPGPGETRLRSQRSKPKDVRPAQLRL